MIRKKPVRNSSKVSVTFEASGHDGAQSIAVVGDFNAWDPTKHTMKRRKDGQWSATIRLAKNDRYAFRYLVDGETWETDTESDATEANRFGSMNSIVET